jgi:D-sedoheptulose 7-phosphate isomerase
VLNYKSEIKMKIEESLEVKSLILSECIDDINKALEILVKAVRKGKKIFLCGNGGSASDSQHIACELIGRIREHSISVPAFSLASNISTLTALSNDFGYENIFSKQLTVYGKEGDILIVISTSGESLNIIRALEVARKLNMKIIGLTGKKENRLSSMANLTIRVPSDDTPRIQEAHIMIGHILTSVLKRALTE